MILLILHALQNIEDAGYFGHANCSDNLSESMSKYGLQRQKAGMQSIYFLIHLKVD